MMRGIITYSLLLFTLVSFAQEKKEKDKYLPKGNREFLDNNYIEAEANYRISQSNSPAKSAAAYNLGNAIYRQKQPGEAAYAYANAIKNAQTKKQKHMAYHNLGNAMMKEKNYQAAVEAYKNALRNNPADEETRYNFALAKKMLKDNPPPKDQKQDPKDQKQDNKSQQPKDKGDNKDKGDKGDQKDKGDKGDDKEKKPKEGDKEQEKQNNDKGKPEEKEGQSPSKQRMENLLDAMNNEEKKIQEKIQAKKVKVQPRKHEKDW